MAEPLGIALVGCGTVGAGVAKILFDHRDRLARRAGRPLALGRVVVRDPAKPRPIADKSAPRHGDKEKSESKKTSYVVKDGDTLASISRKFYKTSKRWKEIRDANEKKIDDPDNLKAGLTLIIPPND